MNAGTVSVVASMIAASTVALTTCSSSTQQKKHRKSDESAAPLGSSYHKSNGNFQPRDELQRKNPHSESMEEYGAAHKLQGKMAAMVVCCFLGTGGLLSWSSMLTAEDYYETLFPRYHPTRVLTLVYQPFALGTLVFLSYKEANINTRRRNLIGFMLFFLSSLLVVLMDLGTSGRGGLGMFIGICVASAAFGVADAHVQGGMVGDLSFMSPDFVQSFLAGNAASGALTSVLRFVTKAALRIQKNGLRKWALMFLSISTFFEFLCILLYAYVFPKLPIVMYYRSKAASEGSKAET